MFLNVTSNDPSVSLDLVGVGPSKREHKLGDFLIITILTLALLFTIIFERFNVSLGRKSLPDLSTCTTENGNHIRTIDTLPGPTPFPWKVIGNIFQLPMRGEDMIPKCFEWCAKYGDCFRLTLFNEDFVVISSAPIAQSILQSNEIGHLTKTDVYHFLQGIDGLAFAKGEWWRSMRKIAAQAFRYQRIDTQIGIYNKHADKLVEILTERNLRNESKSRLSGTLKDEESVQMEVANCVVQIIIETFISQPGCCTYAESMEYTKSWKEFTEITAHRIMHPWLGLEFFWKRHSQYGVLNKAMERVEKFSDTLIHRFDKKDKQAEDKNLLSELLRLEYTHKQIRSEVVAMLFAHETNYLALYYLLYMLAAHPEHQAICRKEVDEIYQARDEANRSNDLRLDDLSNLKHLERCMHESMRLLTPVCIFGRRLEVPLTLSNGVHLPAGMNCLVLPIVIHRMPQYWHDNPSKFDPDRFLPDVTIKRHPFAYLPFSSGPRNCLGMKSSILNMKIVAGKVLRNFVISSPCKLEDLRLSVNLTMETIQDLDLHFTPR